MFKTEQMEKVRMLFSNNLKTEVIEYLHDKGFIDLRKSKLDINDDSPSDELNKLVGLLIKINGALQIIGIPNKKKPNRITKKLGRKELVEKIEKTRYIDRIFELEDVIKESKIEIDTINYANSIAQLFKGIKIDFSSLKSEYVKYKAYLAERKEGIKLWHKLLSSDEVEVIKKENKKSMLIFVIFEKGFNIDEFIKPFKPDELDLGAAYLTGSPEQVIENCTKERKKLENATEKAKAEIEKLRGKAYEMLSLREMLELEIERENVKSDFKKTEYTFLVEGWVQKKKLGEIKAGLEKITKGEFELEIIEKDELAPTLTNRPKILKPFDYIIEFYSIPRSDEIDPTWFFILSFLVLYGMMISDVGYGIVSLIFVTWIATFTDPDGLVHNAAKIWQFAAVSAILFGFVSNQYFGYQLNQYIGLGNIGFDWTKDTTTILLAAVLLGVAQICIGLMLGFVNKYRHGEKLAAISKLTSIVAVVSGIFGVGGAFFGAFNIDITFYSAIISIVSFAVTIFLNLGEAPEITNLISHPLSYARVLGFGLSSVILAILIDKAFTPSLSHGILLFVLFTFLIIILHFINMILGIFEGIVQSSRLNFVEFFSKFYTGGGIKFKPFSHKKIYIK
ncbi:MAG: V-type ATP synthase subunit I [Candidatus Micrarchaeia archaeon]